MPQPSPLLLEEGSKSPLAVVDCAAWKGGSSMPRGSTTCQLVVNRRELRAVKRQRLRDNNVMARVGIQTLAVVNVVVFVLKVVAAVKAKIQNTPVTSTVLATLGLHPFRDFLSWLIPPLRTRVGALPLDVAGHMSGPCYVLCIGIPIAETLITKEVKKRLWEFFQPPAPVQKAKAQLKKDMQSIRERMMPLAEQFEAERLRHKEQVNSALEQMKADLEAWRGAPSISERMKNYMFPSSSSKKPQETEESSADNPQRSTSLLKELHAQHQKAKAQFQADMASLSEKWDNAPSFMDQMDAFLSPSEDHAEEEATEPRLAGISQQPLGVISLHDIVASRDGVESGSMMPSAGDLLFKDEVPQHHGHYSLALPKTNY